MQDVVFDVSHHQGQVDFAGAFAAGMQAVIIKATEGISAVDPTYPGNIARAQAAGLLVGSYHFGNDNDGSAQADHFLAIAQPGVRVLDFEQNPSQMSVAQAEAFIQRIFGQTGKWPLVYADRAHAMELATSPTIVGNCRLWLAQYRDISQPPTPPTGWPGYSLWQHTDQGVIAGLPQRFDRSAFTDEGDIGDWWLAAISVGVAAPSATIYRLTTPLMNGEKVKEIQAALKSEGFAPGVIDGEFGPQTRAAVVAFQLSKGLVADGEVGPETAADLGVQL